MNNRFWVPVLLVWIISLTIWNVVLVFQVSFLGESLLAVYDRLDGFMDMLETNLFIIEGILNHLGF